MKLPLPTLIFSMVMAVVLSLLFVTMGQLYITRQDETAATTDAALTAAAEILQSRTGYLVDTAAAVQAGKDAYQHTWGMQRMTGLTTVGAVTIQVDGDHVSATGTATFIPVPLWPLIQAFPGAKLPGVTVTRTGTASLQN